MRFVLCCFSPRHILRLIFLVYAGSCWLLVSFRAYDAVQWFVGSACLLPAVPLSRHVRPPRKRCTQMHILSSVLCIVVLPVVSYAEGRVDLAKIPRAITKEPAYQAKPGYCLAVFGPEARTRVWVVLDGNVLYVDRNANGDLTDDGQPVNPNPKSLYSI